MNEQKVQEPKGYKESVRQAVGALRLGAPMTDGPLCILPLRSAAKVAARYVLLEQAISRGTLTITEVSDAGAVPYLQAVNKGPWPVLIFDGEELVGAKQNRIANATILVGVGKTPLPVSCVEAGRWSHRTQAFGSGTYTSHPRMRQEKEQQVREHLFTEQRRRAAAVAATGAARRGAAQGAAPRAAFEEPQEVRAMAYMSDQGAVWDEVARTHHALGVRSATSAMSDTYDAGKDDLDRILRNLALDSSPIADKAVGVVVFLGGEFVCLDLLQPAKRFGLLYPKLLRGYALEAMLRKARVAKDFDPEAATLRLFAEILEADVTEQPAADLGSDLRLENKRVAGAGLVWQDELIQLSLFPKVVA